MSSFVDQLMVRYLDAAQLNHLLVPQSDANRQRVRALLAQVYEPSLLTVESVDAITVASQRFQVPVVEPAAVRGTWEKLIPTSERALYNFDLPTPAQVNWVDMALETTVNIRVAATSALLDAIVSEDVSELSQQAFVSKFEFLDLSDLMETAGVATYQELQADFPRLYHLHYADPPAYNPNDPTAQRIYKLRVSVLFFETLDLEGALRRMVEAQRALDALRCHPETYEGGDVLSSSAWVGVFPASVFVPNGITQDQVSALFAAEGFVAAFETV
jgi:hypothetical protein